MIAPDNPCRDRIRIVSFGPDFEDEETYDLVLMLDVLEHIKDDRGATRRLFDLLSPGGHAIITVPALPGLWSMHDIVNRHHRRYTKESLGSTLTSSGLKILKMRYMFGWVAAALVFRRLLSPPEDITEEEPEESSYRVSVPPGPINASLYALCRIEELTIGRVGLPTGSSLIALVGR